MRAGIIAVAIVALIIGVAIGYFTPLKTIGVATTTITTFLTHPTTTVTTSKTITTTIKETVTAPPQTTTTTVTLPAPTVKVYKPSNYKSNGDQVAGFQWLRSTGHYATWYFTDLAITGNFSIYFNLFVHHKISGWPCFGELDVTVKFDDNVVTIPHFRLYSRDYKSPTYIQVSNPGTVGRVEVTIKWRGYDVWPPVNPGPDGLAEHFGISITEWYNYCWIETP